jgi:hypothetical protein
MKTKKSVSYFPVDGSEQALLLRVRESDLEGRVADLLEMVGQIGEASLRPADLAQAIQLLVASRQGDGLEARFDNLEARLKERIEKGLAEIEGRLSKRLTDTPAGLASPQAPSLLSSAETWPPTAPAPAAATESPLKAPPQLAVAPPVDTVPKDANLAFRVGLEFISGESAAQFYIAVWRWLFEHGRVRLADLPIGTAGKQRYEVAAKPVHPSGKGFYRAEEPVPGAFLEVNLSRGDIVRRAKKYLGRYGVEYEVVVGSGD